MRFVCDYFFIATIFGAPHSIEPLPFFEPQAIAGRAFICHSVVPKQLPRSSFAPKFLQTIYN
jgi:hypothetical protein